MSKKQIVIGSLLKPVDDIRHYHKFVLSLAKTNKYGLNIIGFISKNDSSHPDIAFSPLFNFKRISAGRFFAPWKFFFSVVKLTPELIIVNTPELLIVSIAYQILFGGQIVYDIQENYAQNIRHLSPLPLPLKLVAAGWIRLVERLSSPFVSHFILAEKSYTSLPFIGSRWTIIQNKSLPVKPVKRSVEAPSTPLFLMSGTLSLTYGLREGIDAFLAINEQYPKANLHLCGKVPDQESLKYLQSVTGERKQIYLTGGIAGVPYDVIQKAITEADFGLVFYPNNPAIDSCFPTKIWEYMAYRLPMVIQANKQWTAYCLEMKSAVVYQKQANGHLTPQLPDRLSFYPPHINYNDALWATEEAQLLQLVDELIAG